MTKSTITREQAEEAIDGLEGLISRGVQSVYLDIAIAGLRQLVPAMDQKPALHRYRRKAVEPYGPYPWHYEVFVDYPQPFEDIEDEYFYAAPPVVTGFAVDGEPVGKPFMYGIADPDGNAYIDDFCVSEDLGLVEDTVTELNHDREEGDELNYSVVALYRHAQSVPEEIPIETATIIAYGLPTTNIGAIFKAGHDACRAAMLHAGNSPAQSPIDHGYQPECGCSGCKATSRICAELAGNPPANPGCWCRTCRPVDLNDMRFVVCPDCGNKRCPRANDHRNACTGSNEPGQEGSAYPDTPQEVKGE
ncbi:TPA: hypothetical protein ACRR13_001061 [Klebsiella quasipneumoniae]